jgi:hypothetical protein
MITDKQHDHLDLDLLNLKQLLKKNRGKTGGRRPSGFEGSAESDAISCVGVAGAAAA